jgi:hypothetical protein
MVQRFGVFLFFFLEGLYIVGLSVFGFFFCFVSFAMFEIS